MIGKFVFILLTASGLALPPLMQAAFAAEPEIVDGIAAIVNNDVVTYSQVRVLSMPREKLLRSQFTGNELAEKIKEARKAALDDLINRQLILQSFKKESFQIPDHFVEGKLHDIIREDFGGDRNTFIKTLEAQNFTLGQFKKMETERMIVQAMRGQKVKPNTVVSPAKVEEYYKEHSNDFTAKEEIKLRLIMIPSHANESGAAAQKAMAEEIVTKLASGAEFDRMAQIYSEDSSRELGGDWGWVERKTLAGPLEKAAFKLASGKISNIVEFSGNYYILKVEDRRGGATRSLENVRTEIEKKLMQAQAQELQEQWIASLRSKAFIRTF
jgi:peptidyl-prolyl cis-trans isomerase SurA